MFFCAVDQLLTAVVEGYRQYFSTFRSHSRMEEALTSIYIIKIKIQSSCDIEDLIETHLCKLCVILRSRLLRVVCPH